MLGLLFLFAWTATCIDVGKCQTPVPCETIAHDIRLRVHTLYSELQNDSIPTTTGHGPCSIHYKLTRMQLMQPSHFMVTLTGDTTASFWVNVTGFKVMIKGRWRSWRPRRLFQYRGSGRFTAAISGINMRAYVVWINNRVAIFNYYCNVVHMDIGIYGEFATMLRLFKGRLERKLIDQLNTMVCPKLWNIIIDAANAIIRGQG